MTIRELIQRMKTQRETDVVEQVRTLLGDVLGEHTVYKPTSRWQQVLNNLGVSDLEDITACVTCYATTSEIFNTIKAALKKKYKVVAGTPADDLGYRQIFACGQSADAEPSLLLCVNYYEDSRDSVKAQFRVEDNEEDDAADTTNTNADDIDLELEELA